MPRRLIIDLFVSRYGRTIAPNDIDEDLAFKLSMGANRVIRLDTLVSERRRDRSRIFAVDQHAGRSFIEVFGASKEAVAIRLEELRLVF